MKQNVVVIYSARSRKDLLKIEKKTARRIVLKIKENSELKNPISPAKALTGPFTGLYRYRIGDYRIIFEFNKKGEIAILAVLIVKHRKDIYK